MSNLESKTPGGPPADRSADCSTETARINLDEVLTALKARHRAIARYRIVLFDPKRKSNDRKAVIAEHLEIDEAASRCATLNKAMYSDRPMRFGDAAYSYELENRWETLTEEARERLNAIGKGPSNGP